MNIVLVEPEIPQNTGNIARTCAVTKTDLHLIRPLGFSTDDKYLKRAGLDYWDLVNVYYYDSLKEVLNRIQKTGGNCFFSSTKAAQSYSEVEYSQNDFLFFGKETAGLPEDFLLDNLDRCIRIPMRSDARSLNLSNSAAIILYEALRQQDFPDCTSYGKFQQYNMQH
ncbi:MAG: tRNA (uridine(34)/cytosine(34)/5-carboxymethylaminomethyluridine(34)-2'-O)-methyltransferase TrmL [Halanaerobiales bacterium]